jgi:hypothetical protein
MSETESDKPQVHVSVFFCQDVIRENGILTAIRISDAFITDPKGVDKAEDGSEVKLYGSLKVRGVFIFRSEKPASFTLTLKGTTPSNPTPAERFSTPVSLLGSDAGPHVLNMTANLEADVEGAFWFEVYVDDQLAAKVPLYVIHRNSDLYQRLESQKRAHPAAS